MDNILIAYIEPPQQEKGGDYYYRTWAPGVAMAEEEGVCVINLTNVHRRKDEIARGADVLVLKNICDPDMLPLISERRREGRLTVYELADDIGAVPPWNPVHFFYRDPENLSLFKRSARCCDSMQFSVPELKRIYGYLNDSSVVFPNQISTVPPERRYGDRPDIVIGWGGSHGHLEDMVDIAPALVDWITSTDGICLSLMCSEPIWSLFERLPAARKRWFRPGSLDDYYAFLEGIDIGLAPLKDTAFNRSRSDVKFLEYAVHGIVPVVQAAVPYTATVQQGVTGFLFKDAGEMIGALKRLADETRLIPEVGKAARGYVIEERLQRNHGEDRTAFYRARLAELRSGQPVKNRESSLFESLHDIEGAVCSGRHLRLMPTRFEDLLHDGLIAGQVHDDARAAQELFSEASRLEPEQYLPHLFGARYSEDPVSSLQRAIERRPDSLKSWIMLGEEYARRGDLPRSVHCLESASEIFPEYEIPYLRAASLMKQAGLEREEKILTEKAEGLIRPLAEIEGRA